MRATPRTVVIALVVVAVAVVAVVDGLVPPREPGAALEQTAGDAAGGAWVCPVGDTRAGTRASLTAIAPGRPGDQPGQLERGTVEDGRIEVEDTSWVFPLTAVVTPIEGEEAAAVGRWFDAPIALYRRWRLAGEEDLPPGVAAGGCVAETSDRWYVPGMATAGGHEARLRLANPHETDATVAIRLVTPEGPVEPTVLQNVTVPGRSTSEIEVNEHLPERDDVAAEVEVVAGRLAVEGYQLVRQAIGGVDGVSLLTAVTAPSTTWTIPWVIDDDQRRSWLWLHNPGERPAPVELTLHGEHGGVAPEGLAEVTVEPGQLRRIDLRGTFPEDLSSAAVSVRSEEMPVVAAGAVRVEAGDAADTGFAVQTGAAVDGHWVLAGGTTEGRQEQLRLVNPTSEPAVVDVLLWDGASTLRSEELTGVEVPPGALVRLDLAGELGEVGSWAAFVEARQGEVVAGQVGQGGPDTRELVAGAAIPGARWRPSGPVLASDREPGLTQRIGTGRPPAGSATVAQP